jgi:cullin 1
LHERLLPCLLTLIYKDRKGETVDRSLISKITTSFVTFGINQTNSKEANLDVYQKYFEVPFIAATESFYKSESEAYIANNPITEYMKKVDKCL